MAIYNNTKFLSLPQQVNKNKKDIEALQEVQINPNDYVPKTTKIIGLDLQDDILLTEFKIALGNATQSVAGLLSAEDKTHLNNLVALFNEDQDDIVNTIGEILEIFNNYPEGVELVTVLSGKVDKNNAITAGTKAKITYDSKGLVTSGEDLTADDIPQLPASRITQDVNNRFVTANEKSTWNGKQDALTAGDGISISGNVISAVGGITVETWNTATKTLALSNSNKLFQCTYTDNQVVTIPTNATVSFPIGTMITFLLTGNYKVIFSGASGVAITSIDNLVELKTQYAMASLIKINPNVWQLVGALE